MKTEQENVNVNQQNKVSEECGLRNEDGQCSDAALTVCNNKEDKQSSINMTEANVIDDTLNSDVVLSNEVNAPLSESLLTDEHSYANVNNQSLSVQQSSTIIENTTSDELMHVESVLPLDTLNNVISNSNKEINNHPNNEDNDVVPMISSEVVEVITIDTDDIQKTCTKIKDSKNTNLSNEKDAATTADLFYIDNQTSLAAIAAQYDSSDSEEEKDSENSGRKAILNIQDYRNKEVVLSSDETSDSESDSSSSDSDSNSDLPGSSSSDSGDSDDEEKVKKVKNKGKNPKKVFKPKSEFDDLPPIEDLKISVPEVLCDPLGEVAWTVEQMVVVRPKPGKPTLNLDTVLFIDKGQRALGHIFDVFGQVAEPHYCVRFNSSDHIQEYDIKVGMTVYYCPNTPYTSLVFVSELTKMKAIDDLGDDEPPQFSDDEEEQAYLASLRNRANNKQKDSAGERPMKRRRTNKAGWQSNHPWNSNREHQQISPNVHSPNPRPFYRSQHPWSRPRYQQPNSWNQYNMYPANQWMGQYPQYNEVQPYNEYLAPVQVSSMQMPNIRYPQMQWNPHYPVPQMNAIPVQRFPQTLVPPLTVPPPPPPPPPNADT